MNGLAEEIERHPQGVVLVREVLKLFETHPQRDFGVPGPLAHAIETYYGRGYEDELATSVRRSPTMLTLWLANRVANAEDERSVAFVALLREASTRRDLEPQVAQEALNFANQHSD
jgi:hypothetical protein